jgi:hypothetical protein
MWGVFTRYDDLDTILDRAAAIEVATAAIEWARSTIPNSPRPTVGATEHHPRNRERARLRKSG